MMREFLLSMSADRWILLAMIGWPIIAAAIVRVLGRDVARDEAGLEAPSGGPDARVLTLLALGVEAVLGLALWALFDRDAEGWQARVDFPWLSDLGAAFSVGVDGMSLVLVVMTVLLLPLALLGSWNNVRRQTPSFGAFALLLTSGMVGVFVSLDLLLFYTMWELMLIPTYFLIGIWGRTGSSGASLKYVVFTLLGSLLMLVAIVGVWHLGGGTSFHLDHLRTITIAPNVQLWMFIAFFLAFGVKSALVPFHTWLPDAQTGAPTFAAVTLGVKVGLYAILRFAIPLFPDAAAHDTTRDIILALSVVSIIYGALLAMTQKDFKRLASYSSVSHVGFIMLGCFMLTEQSTDGAVMAMLASGVSTSALFLLAGMLEDRHGTTNLASFGGLARVVPLFSFMLTLVMLSVIGLPGTNGFIGEFLVLIGTYAARPVLAIVATSGVIFAAIYGLRALQDILFARSTPPGEGVAMRDLDRRELLVMTAFAVAIIWLGVAPGGVLRNIQGANAGVVIDQPTAASAPVSSSDAVAQVSR
jgi:NADH-quinone oxidoreductase subunit M